MWRVWCRECSEHGGCREQKSTWGGAAKLTIHGGGWKSRFESAVSTLVPLGRYEAAACAASRPWLWLRRWPWPAATVKGDSAESSGGAAWWRDRRWHRVQKRNHCPNVRDLRAPARTCMRLGRLQNEGEADPS